MEVFLAGQYALFLQLLIAALLGVLVGTERSLAGKVAGMRTYGLVSMGACLFILTSLSAAELFAGFGGVDPMRVFEGVITGVGFIGAGMILFKDATLNGVTTAAGLWIAAGIGVTVGYGLYALAVFASVLTVFIFTAMWYIEQRLKRYPAKEEPAVGETASL